MYKCNHCKEVFEKPKTIETTYEEEYGVSGLFPDSHQLKYDVCPHCGEDDIEKAIECEECGEYFTKEELEVLCDGNICKKCFEEMEIEEDE